MRTLVDIHQDDVIRLDQIAEAAGKSRASLIRQAIGEFLTRRKRGSQDDAFGLWGNRAIDGLAYQEKIRGEW